MTVSRRLRFEILRRDGMTCRYCGGKAPDVTLTVDHVIPVALGGGDDARNLVTACADCNSGKSSMPADAAMVEDADATALLFAKAVERAAEKQRADVAGMNAVLVGFEDAWKTYIGNWDDVPADWETSITMFAARGLTASDLQHLILVTERKFAAKPWTTYGWWKFFCGCCWRTIGDRDELALRLIEDGEV